MARGRLFVIAHARVGPLSGKGPHVIVSADVSILSQSVFVRGGATGAALKDSIDLNGATRNTTRLRLFCFSLCDHAINWLDRLPAGSISTCDDLTTRFLAQLFPPKRTAKLRNDILMFQQHQDESFYYAWNRFKDLLQKVPHHGLALWLRVQIFYDHVDYTTQMAIDYAAGGRLRKLRPKEAWETIEGLSQHEEEEWNEPIFSEKGSPDYIDANLELKLESIEHRVESLMRSDVLLVSMISKIEPTIYRTPHQHLSSNLKILILHSFEENKLEYEDGDEVKIKMMGTEMDKESLEHNLYKNDITSSICHNFSITSNPPIKPKDSERVFVIHPETAYTWMAFGGNTRGLSSFGEETDKITDLHQIHEEVLFTERGDGVAGIKRRRRDPSSDGVRA
ncbi:zinc finger, CCHC-type containing protein [Tanacetum coccineum]